VKVLEKDIFLYRVTKFICGFPCTLVILNFHIRISDIYSAKIAFYHKFSILCFHKFSMNLTFFLKNLLFTILEVPNKKY
ncbi:hypothetical protein CEN45_05050, partial [Fischerella thermalis CCMEE 5198]